MPQTPPNVLLITTDQHRADCLGIAGHPVLQTPNLDHVAASGARFARAYSESPVCIPARRTLLTGLAPASHGVVGFSDTTLDAPTVAQRLRDGGYQTALCGKLHLWPHRCRYGFEEFHWDDGPSTSSHAAGDYAAYLRSRGLADQVDVHGVGSESSVVRPWHLDERHHVANWTADRAVDFLRRRDPTRPFFLNVGFFHPHPPLTPPACYLDRYLRLAERDPEPFLDVAGGAWSTLDNDPRDPAGRSPSDPRQRLGRQALLQLRAGYWAQINHVDDQIQRILAATDQRNTLVIFTSDHGEMLGDHDWMRKRVPFEPSARVPMVVRPPTSWGVEGRQTRDELVGLQDVTPTILDAAGLPPMEKADGRSLLPLLQGSSASWRDELHGESCEVRNSFERPTGMQYLVTSAGERWERRWKFCWFPGIGRAMLFDLDADPRETKDLSSDPSHAALLAEIQRTLASLLADRPEGFVRDGELVELEGATTPILPGSSRDR